MANRKLVQIPIEYHGRLEQIQKLCEQRAQPVPTIPQLLKMVITYGLPKVEDHYSSSQQTPLTRPETPVKTL